MNTRLTKAQIKELDDALKGVLRWAATYSHLASLERACSLGFRAVRDLRESLPENGKITANTSEIAGANLRSEEHVA